MPFSLWTLLLRASSPVPKCNGVKRDFFFPFGSRGVPPKQCSGNPEAFSWALGVVGEETAPAFPPCLQLPHLGLFFLAQSNSFQFGFIFCLHLVPLLQHILWEAKKRLTLLDGELSPLPQLPLSKNKKYSGYAWAQLQHDPGSLTPEKVGSMDKNSLKLYKVSRIQRKSSSMVMPLWQGSVFLPLPCAKDSGSATSGGVEAEPSRTLRKRVPGCYMSPLTRWAPSLCSPMHGSPLCPQLWALHTKSKNGQGQSPGTVLLSSPRLPLWPCL